MKLLMIYCENFAFVPVTKTLDEFPEVNESGNFNNVLVAFIHAETADEENAKGIEDKLLKNVKWAAGKNNTQHIILHSFAHLAESKADPIFTKNIFDKAELRLKNSNWQCDQTPFGYFLDLKLNAPGVSQARIFKSF